MFCRETSKLTSCLFAPSQCFSVLLVGAWIFQWINKRQHLVINLVVDVGQSISAVALSSSLKWPFTIVVSTNGVIHTFYLPPHPKIESRTERNGEREREGNLIKLTKPPPSFAWWPFCPAAEWLGVQHQSPPSAKLAAPKFSSCRGADWIAELKFRHHHHVEMAYIYTDDVKSYLSYVVFRIQRNGLGRPV